MKQVAPVQRMMQIMPMQFQARPMNASFDQLIKIPFLLNDKDKDIK